MSILSAIFLYIDQAVLVAVLLSLLPGRLIADLYKRRIFVLVLLLVCMFVPLYGLTAAQWLRSVVGDLSVITMIVFANIIAQRLFNFNLVDPASRKILLQGVVVLGLCLYPLALGISYFDPYQMGYVPLLLTVMIAVVSLLLWLKAKRGLAILLLLPLIACNMNLLESVNLWDYLLDPIVFVYAVVQVTISLKFLQSKKKGEQCE